LVDQSGKLTLEEVVAQRALFQRLEKLSYSAPASDRAVWLQVSLPPLTKPEMAFAVRAARAVPGFLPAARRPA